ncbi:hypothetical protein AGDE_17033 [Angomonas deanei]|uniref:Sec7 domain containing protein, putative n=1 Tax=Angomonas deanei TaxID=59799 RepID=A0A7G2C8C9_9TRYP|nr:hypothetical protein AGDE_17033 [Angomonas deanei]CAD2216110.1 Sec7 domain containing protein, putative [Angomonas deanei]|eukprot:EPY15648.1 hypothetical protein AGDE_17033 [Angomonas deanei]
MLEAKVWERIQSVFGEEYVRQNGGYMTAGDAETMVGVLLFLHANLHNALAKDQRLTVQQFVEDCNACLEIPLERSEVEAIYERMARGKWELDSLGRTPKEAAQSRQAGSLVSKIQWALVKRESEEQQINNNHNDGKKDTPVHVDPNAALEEEKGWESVKKEKKNIPFHNI